MDLLRIWVNKAPESFNDTQMQEHLVSLTAVADSRSRQNQQLTSTASHNKTSKPITTLALELVTQALSGTHDAPTGAGAQKDDKRVFLAASGIDRGDEDLTDEMGSLRFDVQVSGHPSRRSSRHLKVWDRSESSQAPALLSEATSSSADSLGPGAQTDQTSSPGPRGRRGSDDDHKDCSGSESESAIDTADGDGDVRPSIHITRSASRSKWDDADTKYNLRRLSSRSPGSSPSGVSKRTELRRRRSSRLYVGSRGDLMSRLENPDDSG